MVERREAGDRRGGGADDHVGVGGGAPAWDRLEPAVPLASGVCRRGAEARAAADTGLHPGCLADLEELACERRSLVVRIEIELAGGRRIRVDAAVDVGVLKRIVDALEGR
jgi:hypothetical protein